MLCSLSNKLDSGTLESVQNLEKELGKTLLVYSCHEAKPSVLKDEELEKIRSLENRLSVSLVAVDA